MQNQPTIPPGATENDPRSPQDGPKTVLKSFFFDVQICLRFWFVLGAVLVPFWVPFGAPFGTKILQKIDLKSQDRLKSPQERPKSPQEPPGGTQEGPRGIKRHPKRTKRHPKVPKRHPRVPERHSRAKRATRAKRECPKSFFQDTNSVKGEP